MTFCPICQEAKPENRKTCGKFFCRSEHQTRIMRRIWADPERRKMQSWIKKTEAQRWAS